MTDLKLFRLDADGRDVELRGSTVTLEVELQRRVEAGMEAMLGIRFLASEYPTGPWHRGRIDSLGLDENGTPALIEYKKGAGSGVLSQAVSYLSWLDSARHEFEALAKEKLGSEPPSRSTGGVLAWSASPPASRTTIESRCTARAGRPGALPRLRGWAAEPAADRVHSWIHETYLGSSPEPQAGGHG